MNIFEKIFKSKDTEDTDNYSENRKKYKNLLDNINLLVEVSENRADMIPYIVQILIDNLNYREAAFSLFSAENTSNRIFNESFLELFRKLAQELGLNIRVKEIPTKTISMKEVPILINPWKGDRVINNMLHINEENKLDGVKYIHNITNVYIPSFDIIVCENGNHSQFAGKHKDIGRTVINKQYDLEKLYKYVEFDGDGFKNIKTGEYMYMCDDEISFTAGVIFELKRKRG